MTDLEHAIYRPLASNEQNDNTTTASSKRRRLTAQLMFLTGLTLFLISGAVGTITTKQVMSGQSAIVASSWLDWHIKPIKPHHHGDVEFLTVAEKDGSVTYKRIITAPCGAGMLIFNIGPAKTYEPFAYEIYEDAYAYSNNGGLCVLYPSYKGVQTSDVILWNKDDPTSRKVPLGDSPNKISTRVVQPPATKNNTKRGGDFLIIRSGNFYNPGYYKHVQDLVHKLPAYADLELEMVAILESAAALAD